MDYREERGLAGAGGTAERDDLSGLDIEGHPIERHHATEADAQVMYFEQRRHLPKSKFGPARRPLVAWLGQVSVLRQLGQFLRRAELWISGVGDAQTPLDRWAVGFRQR